MRWREIPSNGKRFRRGFLFRPLCIGGEYRWLEFAAWEERYDYSASGDGWRAVRWLNQEREMEAA